MANTNLVVFVVNLEDCDISKEEENNAPYFSIDVASISYTWNEERRTEAPRFYQVDNDPIDLGSCLLDLPEDINKKTKQTLSYVFIFYPVWGRERYLLKKLIKALKE